MKIVCITLPAEGSSQKALHRALPYRLAGIISDLIDAGHQVNWIGKRLCSATINDIVHRVSSFDADVLLFVCDGYPNLPLMASAAVKCGEIPANKYVCESILRPARQWRDTLIEPDLSLQLLTQRIERSRVAGAGASLLATNDEDAPATGDECVTDA